jgi:hypothetical protein
MLGSCPNYADQHKHSLIMADASLPVAGYPLCSATRSWQVAAHHM